MSALDKSHQGPQVILYDMWHAQGWDIITHKGFVTYFHHDVSGAVTFVTPHSGEKIWGIIKVKGKHIQTIDQIFSWILMQF